MSLPIELIALFCEYLSSQEILDIIEDFHLLPQKETYMMSIKFMNKNRYEQIKNKGVFRFPDVTKIQLVEKKIHWNILSHSKDGIHLLTKNQDKIKWMNTSNNPAAAKLIKKYIADGKSKLLVFSQVLTNKNQGLVVELLENHPELFNGVQNKSYYMSSFPHTFHLLNKKEGNWYELSKNPHPEAVQMCLDSDQADWGELCKNPGALEFLEKKEYIDKVVWKELCKNPNASHIWKKEEYVDKLDWNSLSGNPAAISLLEANVDKIVWIELMKNPNAGKLLEENLTNPNIKIADLCSNPAIVPMIENELIDMTKVDWKRLSGNSAAIPILEKNLDKISWEELSSNRRGTDLVEKDINKIYEFIYSEGHSSSIYIINEFDM